MIVADVILIGQELRGVIRLLKMPQSFSSGSNVTQTCFYPIDVTLDNTRSIPTYIISHALNCLNNI